MREFKFEILLQSSTLGSDEYIRNLGAYMKAKNKLGNEIIEVKKEVLKII